MGLPSDVRIPGADKLFLFSYGVGPLRLSKLARLKLQYSSVNDMAVLACSAWTTAAAPVLVSWVSGPGREVRLAAAQSNKRTLIHVQARSSSVMVVFLASAVAPASPTCVPAIQKHHDAHTLSQ